MRLHELEVTAFGPFADTVRVDLDRLAGNGLFLLTGDTGAGKSSVLDAVCFALYGEVPGDRASARHLRSDHAAPDAEPRVVLRFTVGARTFRITRSPAWDRPRRRGEGTRRIQAHVVAEELREDGWHALSTRLDEVGHLVSDLLGMTCGQFTQVVLLPQGRFQAFLRAGSAERHAVLQRLFRTSRFEDVERWLVERRQVLTRRSRDHQEACAAAVTRLAEAAAAAGPGAVGDDDEPDLEALVADGTVTAWARAAVGDASRARDAAQARLARAEAAHTEHRRRLEEAAEQEQARARGRSARSALEQLDRTAPDAETGLLALERHHRARTLLPAARSAERARQAARATSTALARTHPAGGPGQESVVDAGAAHELAAACRRAAEDLAVARTWVPREREVHAARRRVEALAGEVARLTARATGLAARVQRVRQDREHVAATLEELTAAARTTAADQARLEASVAGLAAARRVEALRHELAQRRTEVSAATTRSQDLREHWLDLRERRVSGMAAELASGLVVGCSCPVCGSAEHPSPAAATAVVGRAEEDAAREAHEEADFARQAAQEMVTTRAAELAAAERDAAGLGTAAWVAEQQDARAASERSAAAEAALPAAATRLARLEAEERDLGAELATTNTLAEERRRGQQEAVTTRDRLADELATLLDAVPGRGADDPADGTDATDRPASVAELVVAREAHLAALEAEHRALLAHDAARRDLAAAESALADAAADAGFDDATAALAAVLPDEAVTRWERTLRERRDTEAAARATLDEAPVLAALAAPAVDLAVLADAVAVSGRERDEAVVARRSTAERADRLVVLADELDRVLETWAPVREERALVARTAALVEGTSADNRWRMRLSAYVLTERLRQVVAAANERLVAMTDERYVLEQVDEKGAGERRGGLSLRVRDEWSGTRRDPATLSGGETFVVSLALALGLADTVTHEAAGAQLDTLFIDEGFGSLDATTLDHVMDTLDALRDGGRVVGLVSHVPELRTRVTAQLEVRKGRSGSTVHHALARG